MVTTAHRHLSALTFAKAICPTACMLGVPDERDTLNSLDDVISVAWKGTALEVVDTLWSCDLHTPIPYHTPGVILIDYLYSASSYERSASIALRGSFAREDIAIILGALTAGEGTRFIPSQLGLQNLGFATHEGDALLEDGPAWHTIDGLAWRSEGDDEPYWHTRKPLWRSRALQGYHEYAAIIGTTHRGS